MYGDQHPEGTLDDDTLVFHLDVDSHAFSGRCQVCAIWILSTSPLKKVQVLRDTYESDPSNHGNTVSNAIFHVERGHWLAERAVEGFAEAFRGNVWASGGPTLVL